jgi:hypothetical protein
MGHLPPIPYARNPRKKDGAIAKVKASIQEFGFQQPIVVDKEGIIIVGHTRHQAALGLGLSKVPVVAATNLKPTQAVELVTLSSGLDTEKQLYIAISNSPDRQSIIGHAFQASSNEESVALPCNSPITMRAKCGSLEAVRWATTKKVISAITARTS